MTSGDWISVFMALVTVASTLISFSVYRSSTDPQVIVYADKDSRRPGFFILVIKNIGNGAAKDISFIPDRPLPSRAFSINIPNQMPNLMTDGPIVVGIPFLAPKQEVVISWGQFGGLIKALGTQPISIRSKYKRTESLFFQHKILESESHLDVQSFKTTDINDTNWNEKIAKELNSTNKILGEINKSILGLKNENGS